MKKTYETPNAEMISFQYQEQVVASNADNCFDTWVNIGFASCTDGNPYWERLN
jgi:hypothetical protein